MTDIRQWATPTQIKYLNAVDKHGSARAAARALGLNKSTISKAIKRAKREAARHGYSPEHDMTRTVPDGYKVRGVSTYYNRDGKPTGQWVKSAIDAERQREIMREAWQGMADELPRLQPVRPSGVYNDKLMTVYPLGDPHIGMLSWGEETGADFDLQIATANLCAAMDYLVKQSPPSKRALIANLGDFFHADNMEGITTRSGNVLDLDSRLPKMVRAGVLIMRQLIQSALERHETVEVINAVGNHDDVLSMVLSIMLANIYENEPRIVIHDQPTPRHYVQHGKVLIGVTHGHTTKDDGLPLIMAAEKHTAWGNTKYRYWYRGHHHHDAKKEYNGCIVEQFRTLAAGDAYAVSHGYLSGRDMKCIVHHENYGEVARFVCDVAMLE